MPVLVLVRTASAGWMLGEQPHPAQHLLGVRIAVSLAAVSGPLLEQPRLWFAALHALLGGVRVVAGGTQGGTIDVIRHLPKLSCNTGDLEWLPTCRRGDVRVDQVMVDDGHLLSLGRWLRHNSAMRHGTLCQSARRPTL